MDQPIARTPAMVYGVDQRLCRVFDAEQALRHGTLYPELYKPMRERNMPIDRPASTDKQEKSFVAWELRLYLNTHPDDQAALEMFNRQCAAIGEPSYPCAFVSQDPGAAPGCCACPAPQRWTWLDDPWPWELGQCALAEDDRHVCV